MVTFAALALWFTLLLAPDTPIGRAIHRWAIARPAAHLNRITRGHVLLVVVVMTAVSLAGWMLGHEAVRVMAMGLPELANWAMMFEVTAYVDALAAIVTAASVTRWEAVKGWARAAFTPRRAMAREPRTRRTDTLRTPANDDEDSWHAHLLAA